MIAKFRWYYIFICSLVGYGWKLADYNTIDYQWTSGCIFLQQLIDNIVRKNDILICFCYREFGIVTYVTIL